MMLFDTRGAAAPAGATVLFDGANLDAWTRMDGSPAGWALEDGAVRVVAGAGDICTRERFGDHFLHLEFRVDHLPDARGQARANSGVFLQGRYEIQVLDSHGWDIPGFGDCASVYDTFAPLTNACRPPLEWQTYDVFFRAPRCEGRAVRERARLTLLHNGVVVHNNVELPGVTGAPTDTQVQLPGHLRLQDHGDRVWYRNVWALRLPEAGSAEYGPRMRP